VPEYRSMTRGRETKQRDESTLDLLCEQYLPRVFQYTSFYIDDKRSAEEITLDTLRQILISQRISCDDQEMFLFNLFTAVRQAVFHYLQIQKPFSAKNPPKAITLSCLKSLSSQEREVIALKIHAGLSNQCIGRILGISESTVSLLLYKILSRMGALNK